MFPAALLPNALSKLIPRVIRLYCFHNHRRSAGCRTGGSIGDDDGAKTKTTTTATSATTTTIGWYILSFEQLKRAQRQRGVMAEPPREYDLVDAIRELYAPPHS
jgi:hypothetical protein